MLLEKEKGTEEKGNVIYQEVLTTNRVEDQQKLEMPSEEKGNLAKLKDEIMETANNALVGEEEMVQQIQESAPFASEINE